MLAHVNTRYKEVITPYLHVINAMGGRKPCAPKELNEWLSSSSPALRTRLVVWAARADLRQWNYAARNAASGGYLELLRLLRDNKAPWNDHVLLCDAVNGGHVDVFDWLRCVTKDNKYSHWYMKNAIRSESLEMMKHVKSVYGGGEWPVSACSSVASMGRCDLLRYVHETGGHWDSKTCENAAASGSLETLQYARKNGCHWNADTCEAAAAGGHLEVLKWARSWGCPWNRATCAAAAAGGHLEVLKWARQNGASWNKRTCQMAQRHRHVEVFRWAYENGCSSSGCDLATMGVLH